MEKVHEEIIVKSEKGSQKKKKGVVWTVTLMLIVITNILAAIDYSSYKEGQEYGLASAIISSEIGGASWVDKNDSYAEQCEDVYYKLDSYTYDMTIGGVQYDASEIRESEKALRMAFADVMVSAGYDRYSYYNVANWFKYTNYIEYFWGEYFHETLLPLCCCVVFIISIIFTILVNKEEKKELFVYNDSVVCRVNPKQSKQLLFEDITSVNIEKNTLKLLGTGVKFKISNLNNAEYIKSVIIEKKKCSKNKSNILNISSADELKKYKELLDSGVISKEEFETKKKQIIGV